MKMDQLYPGAHVAVSRGLYKHHGIYAGDGYVLHKDFGPVRMDTLAFFAKGRTVEVVEPAAGDFPANVVLERALSRLSEARRYHPLNDNCEHFVTWCRSGKAESPQVNRAMTAASVGLAARSLVPHPLAGLGVAAVAGVGAYFLLRDESRKQAIVDALNTGGAVVDALRGIIHAIKIRPA